MSHKTHRIIRNINHKLSKLSFNLGPLFVQFRFVLYDCTCFQLNEISANHVKCVKKYIFYKTSLPLATSVPPVGMEDYATAQLACMVPYVLCTVLKRKNLCTIHLYSAVLQ